MLLADHQICEYACNFGMIDPFVPTAISEVEVYGGGGLSTPLMRRVLSYGVGSYGYDMRLSRKFRVLTAIHGVVLDVKNLDPRLFLEVETDVIDLGPHNYMLAETIERFDIPPDVTGVTIGKSTYARAGLFINTTPAEPGWRGKLTLEIANLTPVPIRIYALEGIAQMLFLRGEQPCEHTYATKNNGLPSKYQDQDGVTLPAV